MPIEVGVMKGKASVTWVKMPDEFGDECANAGLSDAAFRTHVEGLLWAMRRETGGYLSRRDVRRFAETADPDAAVAELIGVRFWDDVEDGHQIIRHMEHQIEPAVLARRRVIDAERQRRMRHRRAGISVQPVSDDADIEAVPTVLYRWFDQDDRLLYVGISTNPRKRFDDHELESAWTEFAVRSTIERFPSRPEAHDAEIAAIHAERPLFNQQHNDTPDARACLRDYLVSKDRTELLTPAAQRSAGSPPRPRAPIEPGCTAGCGHEMGHHGSTGCTGPAIDKGVCACPLPFGGLDRLVPAP